MPVLNGEKDVLKALKSIFAQSFKNYELIISNNASCDKTHEILIKAIHNKKNVKYFVQKKTIEPQRNFLYVLNKSKGKYFMWWAADDTRSKNFLFECVLALNRQKEIIAATSPFCFKANKSFKKNIYNYSLAGPRNARLNEWYKNFKVCHGIFYCLIRKEVIKSCRILREKKFFAMDWAIIFDLITKGSIINTNKGLASFGLNGISSQPDFMKKFNLSPIEILFPYGRYSLTTLKYFDNFKFSEKIKLLNHLFSLNFLMLVLMIKQYGKKFLQTRFQTIK